LKRVLSIVLICCVAVFLSACGNTADLKNISDENTSLKQKNEALQEQLIEIQEKVSPNLYCVEKGVTDNPIDEFYLQKWNEAGCNAQITRVAKAWRAAWYTELLTLAEVKKEALAYPEDRAQVDSLIKSTEMEADRAADLYKLSYSDWQSAPSERIGPVGTGVGGSVDMSSRAIYRASFEQLLYALDASQANTYVYHFDAKSALLELDNENKAFQFKDL